MRRERGRVGGREGGRERERPLMSSLKLKRREAPFAMAAVAGDLEV